MFQQSYLQTKLMKPFSSIFYKDKFIISNSFFSGNWRNIAPGPIPNHRQPHTIKVTITPDNLETTFDKTWNTSEIIALNSVDYMAWKSSLDLCWIWDINDDLWTIFKEIPHLDQLSSRTCLSSLAYLLVSIQKNL